MGSLLRIAVVVVGVIAAAASATAPGRHDVQRATVIASDFDATWAALVDLFADRNWAILQLSKESGLITTDWHRLDELEGGYADCGGSGISSVHGTQVRFNVRVKSNDARSEVIVNASFRQLRSFDGRASIIDCASRGAVEAMIHEQVRQRISGGPTVSTAPARPTGQASTPPPPRPTQAAKSKNAVAVPRGYFCATSPTDNKIDFCTREKADCQRAREVLVGAIADLGECRLVEVAFCFDVDESGLERCAPTAEACHDRLLSAASSTSSCGERR